MTLNKKSGRLFLIYFWEPLFNDRGDFLKGFGHFLIKFCSFIEQINTDHDRKRIISHHVKHCILGHHLNPAARSSAWRRSSMVVFFACLSFFACAAALSFIDTNPIVSPPRKIQRLRLCIQSYILLWFLCPLRLPSQLIFFLWRNSRRYRLR